MAGQTGIIERLIDAGTADRARDERQTTATIAALERTNSMLIRALISVVLVLGILVAGVVGVGVTGRIPGMGELTIQKGGAPSPLEGAP
jgi:hypothetical protein